jgi:hypothetical protein
LNNSVLFYDVIGLFEEILPQPPPETLPSTVEGIFQLVLLLNRLSAQPVVFNLTNIPPLLFEFFV